MVDAALQTERLILRRFTDQDVDALYTLGTVPQIIKYTGNKPFASHDDARHYLIAHPLRDYQVYGYGRFACVYKETDAVIGFSGVKHLEEIAENELGYRFLPDYWGKGLATEAAVAVVAYARDSLKLPRLVSAIHPENQASKNVVRKLGFRYEKDVELSFIEGVRLELYAAAI